MDSFRKFASHYTVFLLALICLTSFGLMFWASRTDSAIMDELAHIPAGYGYVHNLDYRLNPEHPPLVKALAMLPVLFLNPSFPTNATSAWQSGVDNQWSVGAQFLYESGNDATAIIRTARIMPILLTLLTIIVLYFFARRLMGPWWALLPAFLFGLSPTILAHGHYVTTDVGAAFGILLGTYFFVRFIEAPNTKNLWIAGIAFGIAQLTKFSTPLLVPLFIFVLFILWIRDMYGIHLRNSSSGSRGSVRLQIENSSSKDPAGIPSSEVLGFRANSPRDIRMPISEMNSVGPRHEIVAAGGRYLKSLIYIFLIGFVCVVYPVYFLFTAHYPIAKQISDTTTILNSFSTGPTPAGQLCHATRCLADLNIWMAGNPVFRPLAQYMLGILMVLQRADGGNTIYFMGHVVGSGGWIYFPLLYLLKEPLPTLIIVVTALILALWWMWKTARAVRWHVLRNIFDYVRVNFAEFTMGSFIVLYWGYSMHSTLNIGIRHIIPTLPFIYILSAGVWKKWIVRFDLPSATSAFAVFATMAKSMVTALVKYGLLIILLVWLFCETLFTAPYFLSYFNELGGGTMNGYHYVTDSNYDWGQDLLRLQAWVSAHPEVDKIGVDYFGGGNPKYYLGDKEVDWSSSKGNPASQGIHWLAVSVNTLELATQPLAPDQTRNASDTYSWLVQLRTPASANATAGTVGNVPSPDYRIGTSIFVYHL